MPLSQKFLVKRKKKKTKQQQPTNPQSEKAWRPQKILVHQRQKKLSLATSNAGLPGKSAFKTWPRFTRTCQRHVAKGEECCTPGIVHGKGYNSIRDRKDRLSLAIAIMHVRYYKGGAERHFVEEMFLSRSPFSLSLHRSLSLFLSISFFLHTSPVFVRIPLYIKKTIETLLKLPHLPWDNLLCEHCYSNAERSNNLHVTFYG